MFLVFAVLLQIREKSIKHEQKYILYNTFCCLLYLARVDYSVGTGFFYEGKAAGVWSWPVKYFYYRSSE